MLYIAAHVLTGTCQAGCQLVLYPWLSFSQCRCAVQEIDCHARGIAGRADEVVALFGQLERTGLATLIIKHCPALEMPSELHHFQDLYSLDIYNCSIVSFNESAVISAKYYWRLGSVYLTRTNLSELPGALLGGDLPPTLLEIGVNVSNLWTVPDDLDTTWPHVRTAYFEHSKIQRFPVALGRTAFDSLSLHNNSITSIPDDAFQASTLNYLMLSSNPLTALPATLGDTSALYELVIQFTDIKTLSTHWIESTKLTPVTSLYAMGSPLCGGPGDDKHQIRSTSHQPHDSANGTVTSGVAVSASITALCQPRNSLYSGEISYSYYPLEGKTTERTPPA